MSSSTPTSTVSYNNKSRSFQSVQPSFTPLIPRREKRKSKTELAFRKYGKSSTSKKGKVSTFQRKLDYMGGANSRPAHFTRKESYIMMRGLLPVEASEEDVRQEICDIIKRSDDGDAFLCGLYDFEFIDMNGKHASVPNVKAGLAFNGKAIKKPGW